MRNKYIFLIGIICSLYLFPLIIHPFYVSHDGENHVARFGAYFKAFKDGQFPPRWAGDLNYSYGSPLFIFFYPLPGYIGSLFHAFGFNLQDSFKLVMGLSFIAAPVMFYLWARKLAQEHIAFLSAFVYGLAPYHFLDLYVRGDIGEVVSFVFIPGVFLAIENNKKKLHIASFIMGSVFYAFLILSHNIMSLIFSFIFTVYIIVSNYSQGKKIIFNILMLFTGLLLSSYFWLPALLESKYINSQLFVGDFFSSHFPRITQLLHPSWGFGSNVRDDGGLSPQIGITHVFIVLVSIIVLLKNKNKKIPLFWLAIFLIAFGMSIEFSLFLWKNVPLLSQFQFPWRFTALSSFASASLAIFVFQKTNNKFIYISVLSTLIISSVFYSKVHKSINRPDFYYLSFPATTYYHGESSTVWTAGDASLYPKSQLQIIDGKGKIVSSKKSSIEHRITVNSNSDITILDNTLYFPGWRVYIDKKEVIPEFQDLMHKGLITFKVPSGNHNVLVQFQDTKVRFLSNMVSLSSIIFVAVCFLFNKRIDAIFKKI